MKGRRDAGGSQGERLGALSWFVLCRVAKNEHQSRYTERAKLGEAGYEGVRNLAKLSASPANPLAFPKNLW